MPLHIGIPPTKTAFSRLSGQTPIHPLKLVSYLILDKPFQKPWTKCNL